MSHTFGYNSNTEYLDELELEDIHNVGLEAIDSDGYYYYISIKSTLGEYACLEFGPLSPDDDLLPDESTMRFSRGTSEDGNMRKLIQDFLKPKKRTRSAKAQFPKGAKPGNFAKIEVVNQMTPDQVLDHAINMAEYHRKFSKTENY